MAWLNSLAPWQAIFAPAGCGLHTMALPAAMMLMALLASVGSECVTGVITPMTPKGANSCTVRPWSPLKTSLRRCSTPRPRSPARTSFSGLCSGRPICVSSYSICPRRSA